MQNGQGEEDNFEVNRLTQYGLKIYNAKKKIVHVLNHTPFILLKNRDSFNQKYKNCILKRI